MTISKSELRRVMGHFATGVTVVTTTNEKGEPVGLTVNSVTSVSLVPPLLLVCVDKAADCHPSFQKSGVFAANILSEHQEQLSQRFATKGVEKFAGIPYRSGETGSPILEGSVGHLECRVVQVHDGGDHTIFIGEVSKADACELPPLLFYQGSYRTLAT